MNDKSLLAGLMIAISLLGGRAVAACTVSSFATFPVTMMGTRPLVLAKINGVEARFLADSGAFYGMISPASASEYQLPLHPAPFGFYVTGVGGEADVSLATVKTLTLADTPVPHVEFLVGGGEVGSGAVGALGQNVLGIGDADYDLANSEIRLMQARNCGGATLVYWTKTLPYSVVDMIWPNRPNAYSQLTPVAVSTAYVNGAKIRVIFDTGAATSVLSRSAAARAGVKTDSPGVIAAGVSSGIGRSTLRTWIGPFASFKVGDEEIRNTHLRFSDIDLDNADMLLGADFFLSHHVYVANSQHKIYFTYNGGPVFNLSAAPQVLPNPAASAPVAAAAEGEDQPKDAEGFSRRGEARAARQNFDGALLDLDQACILAPTEPRYFYQRGVIHLEKRQQLLAISDLNQALKLKPDQPPVLVLRAQLYLAEHDAAAAKADLDAADAAAPKEADVRLTMGSAYERLDLYPQAVMQFDLWTRAHPGDSRQPQALNGRCWTRAQWGQDLDKALGDCNGAIRGSDKTASYFDSRGLVRLRLGDLDRSIADYTVALGLQPKSAWSLYGRGVAETKKGMIAQGQADMAAALVLRPKIAEEAKARGIAP